MHAPVITRSLALLVCATTCLGGATASAQATTADEPPASAPAAASPDAEAAAPDDTPASQPAPAPASAPPKAKVTYKGSLSRAEIESTLRSVKNQVRYCYEKQLTDRPELTGKVVVHFVISGSGAVASAETTPDPGLETVGSCTARVVKRLTFPKPRGGGRVIVNYPYRFSPENKPPTSPDAEAAKSSSPSSSSSASADGAKEAKGNLPPPDAQPAKADEPSYFSKCCGCIP